MDGTRDADEIVLAVREAHSGVPAEAIRSALQDLVGSGYVDDAGAADPPELTERDKERYDRSLRYFRWLDLTPRSSSWEPQVSLRRSKVTVVGLGGAGGVAAMALAASGIGQLQCIDSDTVELSNLNRQVLFTEDDLGAPKADAAVRRLRRLNADIEITGRRLRIRSMDDLAKLALGCDVLVLAADRPHDIRTWANRACLAAGRPWVDVGYHGPLVSVAWYMPGDGACWECLRATHDELERAGGTYSENAPYRREAEVDAAAAPPAGLCGYLAAHVTISLITGVAKMPPGQMETVNLSALNKPYTVTSQRRGDCPGCGPLARRGPPGSPLTPHNQEIKT
jgi:molybdopterin/thiamine biosynthesis adenylyltransferase